MSRHNPIIKEVQRLERRGEKVVKVAPFFLPAASPHVEIHVMGGGPPYPVSVGGFGERDRLLQEFAAFMADRAHSPDGRMVILAPAPGCVAA